MLEEPIKSRTEIQKEKKKSVWYTESVHQIIARSTKSRTEIQEKKKKSVQRTGMCQNTQNTRNAPERTGSAFRLSRRLKILTVKSIFRIKYTKNCKNRSKYDGLYD